MKIIALLAGCLCLLVGNLAVAQVAVGWRTDGRGVYPDAEPPTHWSKQTNVIWSTNMPSRSNAQPVIVGDRLFVCSEPFTLICIDRSNGKIKWQRTNSYRDVTNDEQWTEIEKELAAAEKLKKRRDPIRSKLAIEKKRYELVENKEDVRATIDALEEQLDELKAEFEKLPLAAKFTLPITQRQYNGYNVGCHPGCSAPAAASVDR